jgi:pyroglutamyl-peptidase
MARHAQRRKPVVLLTGFGPFPGVPDNISGAFARSLARRARPLFPAYRVVSTILPVAWEEAPRQLRRLLECHLPALALHFGVSPHAQGLVVETRAVDVCGDCPDGRGLRPARSGPGRARGGERHVTIPAPQIVRRLVRLGLPARLSDDAGAYLCNAVLYHSLSARCGTAGHARFRHRSGFVHLPVTSAPDRGTRAGRNSDARPGWNELILGGLELVRSSLAALPRR